MTTKLDDEVAVFLTNVFGSDDALADAQRVAFARAGLDLRAVLLHHLPDSPCPVLAQDDSFRPRQDAWGPAFEAARPRLEACIPCVGRLESVEPVTAGEPVVKQVGTAWLVGSDVAVTNRHALPHNLLSAVARRERTLRLELCGEKDSTRTRRRAVREVLYIAPDFDLDLAFLRVEGSGPAIALAPRIVATHSLCVIGFPLALTTEAGAEGEACYAEGFGAGGMGVKRLGPGRLVAVASRTLEYDCSTLPGSSGSVVLDLDTGEAVGLHFGGDRGGARTDPNSAVASWVVAERLQRLDR